MIVLSSIILNHNNKRFFYNNRHRRNAIGRNNLWQKCLHVLIKLLCLLFPPLGAFSVDTWEYQGCVTSLAGALLFLTPSGQGEGGGVMDPTPNFHFNSILISHFKTPVPPSSSSVPLGYGWYVKCSIIYLGGTQLSFRPLGGYAPGPNYFQFHVSVCILRPQEHIWKTIYWQKNPILLMSFWFLEDKSITPELIVLKCLHVFRLRGILWFYLPSQGVGARGKYY